jgi:Secretion system C-terminal sorting domain
MSKKLFTVLFLTFNLLALTHAAEYTWTWTGANGNNYADAGNWLINPIADANTAAMGYPRNLSGNTSVVIFNGSANVELPNVATFFISEIKVLSGTVSFTKSTPSNIEIGLDGVGMTINSGARLNIVCDAQGIKLLMTSSANNALINGTLDLTGNAGSSAAPKLEKQNFINPVWSFGSTGKLILSGLNAQVSSSTAASLKFLSGSSMDITRNGGTIPTADYQAGSTINILGCTSTATAFSNSADNFNGDIVWNCPSQAATTFNAQWSLSPTFTTNFKGKFTMKAGYLRFIGAGLNTETFGSIDVQGGTIELGFGSGTAAPSVLGDVKVSGGTLKINGSDFSGNVALNVNGNLVQLGGTINIAAGTTGVGSLLVSGNVTQSGGIITETGTTTTSKLVFNGANAKTATFAAGGLTGDALNLEINKTSNNVTLASGVTVPKDLILTSGNVILGSNNVIVNNSATGGSATSHVVTDGTGTLTMKADASGRNFPIGISVSSYDPVNIVNVEFKNDFTVSVGSAITATPANRTVIPRQWEIVSTSIGASLAFTPSTGSINSAEIGHYEGGVWVFTSSTTPSAPYTASFTSFSPFIIASQVLPVSLVSFTANKIGTSNRLNWQTASEKNNSHFDIERSANGQNEWVKIGSVKGSGNSVITQNYNFADNTPLSISYYRLKQNDLDGTFEYSNVVSVVDKKSKFNIASIAPNPTKETSNIIYNSDKNEIINLTLMDVSGRIVLAQNVSITEGSNNLSLNLSNLTNGLYILNLKNSDQVLIQKIVKQ